jgi:hypothetical protein
MTVNYNLTCVIHLKVITVEVLQNCLHSAYTKTKHKAKSKTFHTV